MGTWPISAPFVKRSRSVAKDVPWVVARNAVSASLSGRELHAESIAARSKTEMAQESLLNELELRDIDKAMIGDFQGWNDRQGEEGQL